jgi:hypothetical protein
VGENHAVEAVDHDVKVAVDERAGRIVDLGISLLSALCLDSGHGLLHHGHGLVLDHGIAPKLSAAMAAIARPTLMRNALLIVLISFAPGSPGREVKHSKANKIPAPQERGFITPPWRHG